MKKCPGYLNIPKHVEKLIKPPYTPGKAWREIAPSDPKLKMQSIFMHGLLRKHYATSSKDSTPYDAGYSALFFPSPFIKSRSYKTYCFADVSKYRLRHPASI